MVGVGGGHSAIFLTFIRLPFVIKIFVLSIFEWPFYCIFFTLFCDTVIATQFQLI